MKLPYEEENLQVFNKLLKKLNDHTVKLKRSKCVFVHFEIVYLGLKINDKGLQPVKEKTEAIVNAPKSRDVLELRSFQGIVQYYLRFLPELATVLAPLQELLKKDVKWKWSKAQQDARKGILTHL
ncbi:uncharacterized protein [Heterodontus francisci]|uniref:uncharacterized protein n=1 Tax=Heterodontus francisci TaxID=7792 RepID=UPI00355AF418